MRDELMTDHMPEVSEDSAAAADGSNLGIDVAVAPELEDSELGAVLEALLLVVDTPATVEALAAATDQPVYRIAAKLRAMADELAERDSGIDLREAGGGWRYYTRARFAPYVERLLLDGARSKLTRAALETLAVIAYRQPVTRARVSAVRACSRPAMRICCGSTARPCRRPCSRNRNSPAAGPARCACRSRRPARR